MKRRGKINGLNHVCIYTENLAESVQFYQHFFGFECFYETSAGNKSEGEQFPFHVKLLRQSDFVLELIEPALAAYVHKGVTGAINHIGLDVTNIELVVEDLREKGMDQPLEIGEMPDFYYGIKAVSIKGPSGETISLYEFY